MATVVRNEKTFEYFSDFIPELRQCVVDEMQPTDRCRFTRCSKRSREEAKRSKNYIYGLGTCSPQGRTKNYINLGIKVKHGKYDDCFTFVGYNMRFTKEDGRKFKICENSKYQELWREELDNSTNLVQLAADYFQQLLRTYQNRIQHASFRGKSFKDYDFEITSMKNMKILETDGWVNSAHYLSKLQNPLKKLYIHFNGSSSRDESVAHCEQIYQVRETVLMSGKKFSVEQVLRFSAELVTIHIGNLTERDICTIIRSWQNRPLKTNGVLYTWYLEDSRFNVRELWRLLGQHHEWAGFVYEIEIEHNIELGKKASLHYSGNDRLSLCTFQPKEQEA